MMAGVDVARVADCPVCLGTFKDPRVLPCGHTFCLDCITKHGKSKYSDPDCPNCRTKFQIPFCDFDALPKNYSLNSVLYEKAKVTKGLCKKHDGEELVLYCVQCNMIICLDCMEDDHQKHDCSKINRFAKEAQAHLKCSLSQVRTQISEVDVESKKFSDMLSKTELAINEECDSMMQLVNSQRHLLLEELSSEKQEVTKDLKVRTEEIKKELLRHESFNTRIEEMLPCADEATPFDIVCQYKDFKELSFSRVKHAQPQTMGQASIAGIEYMPGDVKDFISQRENRIRKLRMESDSRPKVESSWVFLLDRDPWKKQLDHTILHRFPIDQLVWLYLECKHKHKVVRITDQHSCIARTFYESSFDGIAQHLEVVPCFELDSDEARKHLEDAVEEFAQLYQEVAQSGIVKESIELPFSFNDLMPVLLKIKLEEMGVFFLKSHDGPCLVGPRACMQGAKQRVSDFGFEHYNQSLRSAQEQRIGNFCPTQALPTYRAHVKSLVFKTPGGLTVHVRKGGLVHQSLDAIVSPANESLSNVSGVTRAIADAAGYRFQMECNKYIREEGKLNFDSVMHTSAGNLRPRIKYVIHTVAPWKFDAKDDKELVALVRTTVFYCLNYANGCLNVQSLGIPAIGSGGICGMPTAIVSRASFEALKMFDDRQTSSKKDLREIHFLDEDEATVSIMQRIFQSLMT